MEPCDRTTYGEKLREAAEKLGVSLRTVQRLVKNWEQDGLVGLTQTGRADKGKHRIGEFWEKFITKTYNEGNKGSKRMTPKQVALRVEAKARELKDSKPPNYKTVLRVLAPILEKQEKTKSIRSPGWRGTTLSVKTPEGKDLSVDYSNHVWQCDHTRVDVLLVDQHGELLSRPWLTTVIDTYSRCIMSINLGFDAPSSGVVALALRHAILPKQYGFEYKLHCEWGTYGKPEHFYTDGGKDFRSNHLSQIGAQLGFVCHLRDRPSEGGVVERPFKTLNDQLFSTTEAQAIAKQLGGVKPDDEWLQAEIARLKGKSIVPLQHVKTLHDWLDGKRKARKSCRVVGESRTGKTVACAAYIHIHKPQQEAGRPPTVPVVYIRPHQKCGPKDLFKKITEYLKYRVAKGTVSDFRDRTIEVLKGCGVEMLIIDEADRLKPETFADVRDIAEDLGIAVVLVGTDRLDAVIKRDEQVLERFRADLRFGKLSGEDFKKTVEMWEQMVLKLPVSSNLTSKEMLRILTSTTEGYIGRLDEILREAAICSLSRGLKKIDKAVLQEVAKEYK